MEVLDSLKEYRSHGIISVGHQTERLTEQYAIALASNNLSGAKRIKSELDQLFYNNKNIREGWKVEKGFLRGSIDLIFEHIFVLIVRLHSTTSCFILSLFDGKDFS